MSDISRFIAVAGHVMPANTIINNDVDTPCAKCGTIIKHGDECCVFEKSDGFADFAFLAARTSGIECGHCAALSTQAMLTPLQYALITENGWFRISKDADIVNMLLNPPKGKWSALISTGKNQHLAWKARLNYERRHFTIRLGTNTVSINHARLMSACKVQAEIIDRMTALDKENGKKRKPRATIFTTDGKARELKCNSIRLSKDILDALKDTHQSQFNLINSLSIGERWAVFVIGCSKLFGSAKALPKMAKIR